MLEGSPLVLLLLAAVTFIIIATAKLDLHAFLALLIAAYLTGVAAGLDPAEAASLVTDGFGGILGYIGIVIIAGTIIGTCLERSGAAIVIAETILDYVGEEHTTAVMAITGSFVSIPVFCDSWFVILSVLNRSLAQRSGLSLSTLGVALAGGLYVTHVFVPPTPGPIAAAGIIGADIGLVMIAGIIVSAPIVFIAALWADKVASNYHIDPNPEMTIEEIKDEYGTMPSRAASFAPLLVPIALIAVGSVAAYPEAENPEPFASSARYDDSDFREPDLSNAEYALTHTHANTPATHVCDGSFTGVPYSLLYRWNEDEEEYAGPRILATVDWGDGSPHPHSRFSPDGSQVLFDSDRWDGSSNLYLVDVPEFESLPAYEDGA
jgi:H+/gluconate symporter-like permease